MVNVSLTKQDSIKQQCMLYLYPQLLQLKGYTYVLMYMYAERDLIPGSPLTVKVKVLNVPVVILM